MSDRDKLNFDIGLGETTFGAALCLSGGACVAGGLLIYDGVNNMYKAVKGHTVLVPALDVVGVNASTSVSIDEVHGFIGSTKNIVDKIGVIIILVLNEV